MRRPSAGVGTRPCPASSRAVVACGRAPTYLHIPACVRAGRYDITGIGNVVAVHMTAIPGTDNFLFMERPSGYHPDGGK